MEVEATVQTRTELNDARRFGFTFADSRALRVKLNAGLLELFNQRKAFRVEPSATVPVTVRIRVDELEITGRLRDISTDGVGVLMDATAEDQLSHVLDVNLVLHLPDGGAPLRVKASIRNRTRTRQKEPHLVTACDSTPRAPPALLKTTSASSPTSCCDSASCCKPAADSLDAPRRSEGVGQNRATIAT